MRPVTTKRNGRAGGRNLADERLPIGLIRASQRHHGDVLECLRDEARLHVGDALVEGESHRLRHPLSRRTCGDELRRADVEAAFRLDDKQEQPAARRADAPASSLWMRHGDDAARLELVVIDTGVRGLQHRARGTCDFHQVEALHRHGEQHALHVVNRHRELVQARSEHAAGAKERLLVRHRGGHQRARLAHLGGMEQEELTTGCFGQLEVRRVGPPRTRPAEP